MTASSPTQASVAPARNPGTATPMAPELAITTAAPTDSTQIPTAVIPPINAPRHGSTTAGSNDGNEGTLPWTWWAT